MGVAGFTRPAHNQYMDPTPTVTGVLPAEQFARLEAGAREMGLDVPAYVAFLEQCRLGRLDGPAQAATLYVFSRHGDSLRKLAE